MKLTCDKCGARFYDLNKTPPTCPACGGANSRPVVLKRGPSGRDAKRAALAKVAPPPKPEATVDPEADDEEEGAVIEDTSDLGGDDDVEIVETKEEPL